MELANIKLISGRSNLELATLVSQNLGIPLTKVTFKDFGNTEIFASIDESVRGYNVYIIQTGGSYRVAVLRIIVAN